jgi:hypothetical protein
MMIVLRDIKGNELKLSHGSDFCFKDVQIGREVHLEWPELPKMLQHELDDLASRAIGTMEQARELVLESPRTC